MLLPVLEPVFVLDPLLELDVELVWLVVLTEVLVILAELFIVGNALWLMVMGTADDSEGTFIKKIPNPMPDTKISASIPYKTALLLFLFILFVLFVG